MIAIAGQLAVKSRAIVSHSDNYEMLLVRTGHHLWKWYMQAVRKHDFTAKKYYADSFAVVCFAKALYRKPFLERKEANKQATATRLRKKAK